MSEPPEPSTRTERSDLSTTTRVVLTDSPAAPVVAAGGRRPSVRDGFGTASGIMLATTISVPARAKSFPSFKAVKKLLGQVEFFCEQLTWRAVGEPVEPRHLLE